MICLKLEERITEKSVALSFKTGLKSCACLFSIELICVLNLYNAIMYHLVSFQ